MRPHLYFKTAELPVEMSVTTRKKRYDPKVICSLDLILKFGNNNTPTVPVVLIQDVPTPVYIIAHPKPDHVLEILLTHQQWEFYTSYN